MGKEEERKEQKTNLMKFNTFYDKKIKQRNKGDAQKINKQIKLIQITQKLAMNNEQRGRGCVKGRHL